MNIRNIERILKVLESAIEKDYKNGDAVILMPSNPWNPAITIDDVLEAREELEGLKIPEIKMNEIGVGVGVKQLTFNVMGLLPAPVEKVIRLGNTISL